MSIGQGHALYASIIIFILSIIALVVVIVVAAIGFASSLVSQGYTTQNIPASELKPFISFVLTAGVVMEAISAFCYFLIPYTMVEARIRTILIGTFVASIVIKAVEVVAAESSITSSVAVGLPSALSVINSTPTQLPYLIMSIVSAMVMGLFIIFLGNYIRSGKIMPFPEAEEDRL